MNNNEEKNTSYAIAITILSFLVVLLLVIIVIGIRIISDLNDTIEMHKNTIKVCKIDLEQIQIENEELRNKIQN